VRLQAKLLRAIQEREIDRVGGTRPVKVNIRILATSNRDLAQAVREGSFREDLLYRLNVITLHIPPLRERPADITALAAFFGRKYALANNLEERGLSDEARTKLAAHNWPGNVRELENAMHRAVLVSTGAQIDAFAVRLPDRVSPSNLTAQAASRAAEAMANSGPAPGGFIGQTVAEVEQHLILGTLSHCFGNRTHAANILGISIRTLRNKLKDYADLGLDVPAPQGAGASAA